MVPLMVAVPLLPPYRPRTPPEALVRVVPLPTLREPVPELPMKA